MRVYELEGFLRSRQLPAALSAAGVPDTADLRESVSSGLAFAMSEAVRTIGLQDHDDAALIVSPGTLVLSGLPGDRVVPAAVSIGRYAQALVRYRNDNQVVVYTTGYDIPIHIGLDDLAAKQDEWGAARGLLRGTASLLHNAGAKLRGFDAFIDSPFQPGQGFSASTVLCALFIGAFLGAPSGHGSGRHPAAGGELEQILLTYPDYESAYFGSRPSGLPLAAGLGGGIWVADGSEVRRKEPADTPSALLLAELPRSVSIGGSPAVLSGNDLNVKHSHTYDSGESLREIFTVLERSRSGWDLGEDNRGFIDSLRSRLRSTVGTTPIIVPYATNRYEIRNVLVPVWNDSPVDYRDPVSALSLNRPILVSPISGGTAEIRG